METIRYAVYDNYRVLKATDNYIEKYLPFTLQNMVSKNILTILSKKELANEQSKQTEKQKLDQELYNKFKLFEYETYKEIHRVVLADDGNPKLKKTAFSMPGYRKIMGERGLAQYEIDNDIVPDDY